MALINSSSHSAQLKNLWLNDRQAKRFSDVTNDTRFNVNLLFDFFGTKKCYDLLKNSEVGHDRPALAGVVKEFEQLPQVKEYFNKYDSHITIRLRQAVGVIVRLVMERLCVEAGWEETGWKTTGKKGSLGTRAKVPPRTTTPGAYRNKRGLSEWFTYAERYEGIT